LPMEPSPESGPGPMELGVEQGVLTCVSCCDICAIDEIGSKQPLTGPLEEAGTDVEVGVAGLSGMLSGGARPRWPGDMPPGNREPGLAGTGNRGSGDGKLGRALSWPLGV